MKNPTLTKLFHWSSFAALLLALSAPPTRAAGTVRAVDSWPNLTLEQALREADRNHPAITAALARWNAAEKAALQAGLRPNPKLVIGTEGLPVDGRSADQVQFLAGFNQQIRRGSTVRLQKEIAAARREQAALEYAAARARLRRDVHAAYAAAIYAQENERMHANRIDLLTTNAAGLKRLADAGEAVPEAAELAHARLDHERLDHHEASERKAQALAALAVSMGLPDAGIGRLVSDLESAVGLDRIGSAAEVLREFPATMASAAEADIRRLRAGLAKAKLFPALNLQLLYRGDPANRNHGVDAQVSVALPLFNRGENAAAALEASALAAAAETEVRKRELALRFDRLRRELELALDRVAHIREEILPHQAKIRDRRRLLFEAGESSRLDFNAALLDYTEERAHFLEALREVHRIWADLREFLPETKEKTG